MSDTMRRAPGTNRRVREGQLDPTEAKAARDFNLALQDAEDEPLENLLAGEELYDLMMGVN